MLAHCHQTPALHRTHHSAALAYRVRDAAVGDEGIEVAAGDVAGPDLFEVGFGVAFDGFTVEPHGFGSDAAGAGVRSKTRKAQRTCAPLSWNPCLPLFIPWSKTFDTDMLFGMLFPMGTCLLSRCGRSLTSYIAFGL